MRYGVCTDPINAPALAQAGFEFIELHVQNHLKTVGEDAGEEAAFAPELARIQASALPCEAANCFLPGNLKITGTEVDMDALAVYVDLACARAARAGIQTIVFGSGGARRIPDGFSRDQAWRQLLDFGKMLGPVAQRHGVLIVVEPLNLRECNVFTTVGESAEYVRQVDHPYIRLLVDGYHWALDNDSYDDLVDSMPLIAHAHIATYASRKAPGLEACDFAQFFDALKKGGFDGRLSIEGRWDDMAKDAPKALEVLQAFARTAGY
ncbi:MAG: sugar phosphate isomerase/epimerase [Anaerolineae bacterium]|nr:sugar phosphate isomerase/epimerase [Anaerolineae bacterium]